ncbi:MFS transporter [Corynebacterium xerosis]|uniref:MFS transporter n=1 Tax=Corynebacterium xerosis TaxID=1725 RepID=A0A7X9SWE5_9CORY|nr:MFS transporter [Corynebacterium xerosis]NMF09246.1 MFS transporter [Corynebacterium xerosis]SQB96676.1 drug resistance transporter, EmrB/QacA subfamily [Clostridium paraputrificum]
MRENGRDKNMGAGLCDAHVTSYPLRWWGVAVLALSVVILAIDMTVLNFALPAISRDLDPSGTQLLWIVDIYAFVIATLLITMGTLGDRIGRRKLLMWGIAGFGAASLLAAYSVSPLMLIIARALQGVAGATLMPSTLSLIKAMFPDKNELPRAIAVWISCYSLGAIIGPVLGGWLLEHFHWGSVFIINVPVAVAVIAGGLLVLPESKSSSPGKFDVAGAVLSMAALFGVVGALKAATAGLAWWIPALLATAAILAAGALVSHLNNSPHPLVDVRLLRDRAYAMAVVINAMSSFLLVGAMFYLTQYLQVVLGISPVHAGLLLMPGMVASMAATMITGEMVGKFSARPLLLIAITLAGAGLAMHVVEASGIWPAVSSGTGAQVWFGASFILLGVGAGMIDPVTNTIILGSAPPEQSGAASALSETGYELGGAFGAAILGAVLVGTYSRELSAVDLPLDPSQSTELSDNVNSAHVLAESLPDDLAAAVIDVADKAFTSGMGWASAVAVGCCIATAIAVRAVLPDVRAGGADSHEVDLSERR